MIKKLRLDHLTNRLVLVVAVVFLPISVLMIGIAVFAMGRASAQIVEASQREFYLVLDQLQEDLALIDTEMDEFAADYLTELSTPGDYGDLAPYEMIGELEKILEKTGLGGFASLCENGTGRYYTRYYAMKDPIGELESRKSEISRKKAPKSTQVFYMDTLNGESYAAISYEYANFNVSFRIHLGAALAGQLATFLEEGNEVFVYDGISARRLTETGGMDMARMSWEECMSDSFRFVSDTWSPGSLPFQVCIRFASVQAWQLIPAVYWTFLIAACLALLLIPLLWKVIRREIFLPLGHLSYAMKMMEQDHLDYRITDISDRESVEMRYLFENFNNMATEVELSRKKDVEMLRSQLDNLRLQVNPHMLLNSFNMIYSLAQTRNFVCIQEYSMHLVEYFRYALRKNDDLVPLKQELDFIESYIKITKIRFPNAFAWVYDIEDSCQEALVPPLLIQNFVENAMKYALIPGKIIEVILNIRSEDGRLLISVCDTGKGIKEEVLEELRKGEPYIDRMGSKHIGIWNCMRRVEVFFGEKADFRILSARNEGTQIWLNIPFRTNAGEGAEPGS